MTGRHLRVRELLRAPGTRKVEQGAFEMEPAGTTTARIRDGANVTYELALEARGGRVRVTGEAAAPWVGPCRRCLDDTTGEARTRIDEFFEVAAVPGETWPITDGVIDLAPVLREAIVLELPLVPLCREDCPGPDPERYPTSTVGEADEEPRPDPRWAALEGLQIDEPDGERA